jgi:hypothetical protein
MFSRITTRLLPFMALAAILALADKSPSQQAQNKKPPAPPGKSKPAPKPPPKPQEIDIRPTEAAILRGAHRLLAAANFDYKGHRQAAMGHVAAAANVLKSGVPNGIPWPHESKALADSMMRHALREVVKVEHMAKQKNQGKVLEHVKPAIHHILEALKTVPPPAANPRRQAVEAHVLREAYILMAIANPLYRGEREKAMDHVARAVQILDHTIMKHGTNGQKVVAIEEEIRAARASFLAKIAPPLHESPLLSNLQMNVAGVLLVDVRAALVLEKQRRKDVLHHVNHAIDHVTLALTTP